MTVSNIFSISFVVATSKACFDNFSAKKRKIFANIIVDRHGRRASSVRFHLRLRARTPMPHDPRYTLTQASKEPESVLYFTHSFNVKYLQIKMSTHKLFCFRLFLALDIVYFHFLSIRYERRAAPRAAFSISFEYLLLFFRVKVSLKCAPTPPPRARIGASGRKMLCKESIECNLLKSAIQEVFKTLSIGEHKICAVHTTTTN